MGGYVHAPKRFNLDEAIHQSARPRPPPLTRLGALVRTNCVVQGYRVCGCYVPHHVKPGCTLEVGGIARE